jgi:tRNA 2-thiouridine synthesizing protein E
VSFIEFKGEKIAVDEYGYLINYKDWSRSLAAHMAKEDNFKLTKSHWEIIFLVRRYFKKYQGSPMIKPLVLQMGRELGSKKGTVKYLYSLFPNNPAVTISRYAGVDVPCHP